MVDINNMTDGQRVIEQYSDTHNLEMRQSLHEKYSVNKIGFQNWMFGQYRFAPKIRILELGSGRGEMWKKIFDDKKLQDLEMDITLSDFTEGMTSHLRDLYKDKKISVKQIDIVDIPYEAETFDIVIANAMLYHVRNIDKAVSEVKRVMKTDGIFYTSTFGLNGMMQFLYHAFDQLEIPYSNGINISFTLQNGAEILGRQFEQVELRNYEDALEIARIEDYLDYIYSMASLDGLERKYYAVLKSYFESKKADGYLHVPKEYGMFVAVK